MYVYECVFIESTVGLQKTHYTMHIISSNLTGCSLKFVAISSCLYQTYGANIYCIEWNEKNAKLKNDYDRKEK